MFYRHHNTVDGKPHDTCPHFDYCESCHNAKVHKTGHKNYVLGYCKAKKCEKVEEAVCLHCEDEVSERKI